MQSPAPTSTQSICPRCGSFAAHLDTSYDVCPPCVTHVLPEGARGEPRLAGLWHGIGYVLRADGLRILGVSLALATPCAVTLMLVPRDVWRGVEAVFGLVTLLATIVVMLLGRAALLGRNLSTRDALQQAADAYPRVFWALLVAGFYTLLWTFLFVLPGIYMRLRYSLAGATALFGEARGDAAVSWSSERMRGRIGLAFSGMLVAGALWAVGFAAIVLASIFVSQLSSELSFSFVLASMTWLSGVSSAVLALTNVVLHEQILVHDRSREHAFDAELEAARQARHEAPLPRPEHARAAAPS